MNKLDQRRIIIVIRKIVVNDKKTKLNKDEETDIQNYIREKVIEVLGREDKDAEHTLYLELFTQNKWIEKNRSKLRALESEKLYQKFEIKAFYLVSKGKQNIVSGIEDIENIIVADPDGSPFGIISSHGSRMRELSNIVTNGYLDKIVKKGFKEFCQGMRKSGALVDCLKKKYQDTELIARWLCYSFPAPECFEALLSPKEIFLQSLLLKYGERWEIVIASASVKAEIAKTLGKEGKAKQKIINELRKFYSQYIPNLTKQVIEGYYQPALEQLAKRVKDPENSRMLRSFLAILWESKKQ